MSFFGLIDENKSASEKEQPVKVSNTGQSFSIFFSDLAINKKLARISPSVKTLVRRSKFAKLAPPNDN